MKIDLADKEIELLRNKGILFEKEHDFTDDEALYLLDQARDIEVSYSQFTGGTEERLFFLYGSIADKIHAQIPED